MNPRAALAHILICLTIGGFLAAISPARWIAASLWTSSVLLVIGALAVFEDAQPGGFDNPSQTLGLPITRGVKAVTYWLKNLVLAGTVAGVGLFLQLGRSPL